MVSTLNYPPMLIDLHRHLDGNVRVKTILELAETYNIALPSHDIEELAQHVFVSDTTPDLMAFLRKLDIGVSVLGSLDACKRIAYENVQDAINEGLHHVELRFSPYYMSRAFQLPMMGVIEAVIDGVREANNDFAYNAKLIGILSRTFGATSCMQELEALLTQKEFISAIDLAGDEKGFPAHLFTKHFDIAKQFGMHVTVHAGEASNSDSIWDAINLLHADRIGHGVSAYKDPALMDYMANHKIGLESCILSNYQTGTWLDIATHPVGLFLDNGIEVFLNTDDPGISNNTLESEYKLAKDLIGLSASNILCLQKNAFQQAFLTDKEKDAILASL